MEEETVTPDPDKKLYVRAFENMEIAAALPHEGANVAYWKEQYEALRAESFGDFSINYGKGILGYYGITFASALGGHFAAGGALALGLGPVAGSTIGGVGGGLSLEGSQHLLGKIGGYDRSISGERFSLQSYVSAGASGGAFGFTLGLGGRFFSGGAPTVGELSSSTPSGVFEVGPVQNPVIPDAPKVEVDWMSLLDDVRAMPGGSSRGKAFEWWFRG
jgi:hypothetical protein